MKFSSFREELLYRALRIRLVEERVIELYPFDKIQSPVHLSIGQEAVAVGVCHSLANEDLLFCSYRSHAFYLAKGGDLSQMFAELYGKVTGCARGKAGSMHLAAPEVGLMGASAVVASTIPHAVGAALAADRRGTKQVIVAAFGDGAVEEGVYHESLNFAALNRLPVIFLCENNGLAVHSLQRARQSFGILDHARTYGLPVTSIPAAREPLEVHEAFSVITDEVRRTRQPHFVEIETFRYMEHVGVKEDYEYGYRPRAELERWQEGDPLLTDRELVERLTPSIVAEIAAAVEFAEQSPWPDTEELLAHVL